MSGPHPVWVSSVHIGRNKQKILFLLKTSKTHGEYGPPQIIKINSHKLPYSSLTDKNICQIKNRQLESDSYCPYMILRKYISFRPKARNDQEPFFIFRDHTPVKPIQMRNVLKQMLHLSGFNSDLYNCQSLRIGCTSDLLKLGISVETIKKLGRWRSNAVFSYLRTL